MAFWCSKHLQSIAITETAKTLSYLSAADLSKTFWAAVPKQGLRFLNRLKTAYLCLII
jgi:hypothetical protein